MHRADSVYDDRPSEHYQFPKQYLNRALSCVGDWIVYLEPSKVQSSRGYFAVTKVREIIPDPILSDMFLAIVEPGTFLEFPNSVAFNIEGTPVERGLLNDKMKLSGRAQAAVRPISTSDFNRIVTLGLADEDGWPERVDEDTQQNVVSITDTLHGELDAANSQAAYIVDRPIITQLTNRKYRDARFKHLVRRAYDRRCAFTGLRLINGKGRPEVEAAHIRPVSENGPDSVRNGIALSGTVHWMFDRGMLGLSDQFDILISRQLNHDLSNLLVPDLKAMVPNDSRFQPHPDFLDWHRQNIFKR